MSPNKNLIARDNSKCLSPREKECLKWLAKGKTTEEIAMILNLQKNTVRGYFKNIRIKLNCVNLYQALFESVTYGYFF